MDDGTGTTNRRLAVAAADWESVGGAWMSTSEGRIDGAGLDRQGDAPDQAGRKIEEHRKRIQEFGERNKGNKRNGKGDRARERVAGDKPKSDTRCNTSGQYDRRRERNTRVQIRETEGGRQLPVPSIKNSEITQSFTLTTFGLFKPDTLTPTYGPTCHHKLRTLYFTPSLTTYVLMSWP